MGKTNAEKYEEVFGFPPDKRMCPTTGCEKCPVLKTKPFMRLCTADETWLKKWWDSEYEEVTIPDELERRTISEDILKEIEQTGHDCKNCKHIDRSLCAEPCMDCDIRLGNNKWEPKDEEDGDKS